MKLEVGMYVRVETKGNIKVSEITKVHIDEHLKSYFMFKVNDGLRDFDSEFIENIKLYSHDITEVLKDDDVIKLYFEEEGVTTVWVLNDNAIDYLKVLLRDKKCIIKSVLTKEQYEAHSFKVVE